MLTLWFPTVIYDQTYPEHVLLKDILMPVVLSKVTDNPTTSDWIGNVPNSLNIWNPLLLDMRPVEQFRQWVEEQTNELAFKMGSMDQFGVKDAWANVYGPGHFQEGHYHPGSHFSAVYFLSAPSGSGGLRFESPLMPDMMPLNLFTRNELTNESAVYPAEEGKLIIFRSSLRHGVYPHASEDKRISLAMNLVKIG